MNQPLFLHIVERLEGFLGKLPASIQKPILHELTPLKELFLKQRYPRLVLTGSHKVPVQEFLGSLFSSLGADDFQRELMEVYRWHEINLRQQGTVAILDARAADDAALRKVGEELQAQPGDIFFHLIDGDSARPVLSRDLDLLEKALGWSETAERKPKIIGVVMHSGGRADVVEHDGKHASRGRADARTKLQAALEERANLAARVNSVVDLDITAGSAPRDESQSRSLLALLARELPNEARVEMIRIIRDRAAQLEIAQVLVKSTTAISTAIGAQPIPLADLPILTTLQLVMVSGIMYVSGRERSLRAATEFAAALGVNVGAGMILREGARAILKFFPGWGNVVCGMVAGAGTYGLGRAATAYFIEGVTLKDARRTYRLSKSRRDQPSLPGPEHTRAANRPRK